MKITDVECELKLNNRSGKTFAILIYILGLFCFQSSSALSTITLSIEQLLLPLNDSNTEHTQIKPLIQTLKNALNLQELKVELNLSQSPATLAFTIDDIKLPEPYEHIKTVSVFCHQLTIEHARIGCQEGSIQISGLFNDSNNVSKGTFSFYYDRSADEISFVMSSLNIEKGELSFDLKLKGNDWAAIVNISNLEYQWIKIYLNYYFNEALKTVVEPDGRFSFKADLSGTLPKHGEQTQVASLSSNAVSEADKPFLESINLNGQISRLRYSIGDDLAENLSLQIDFRFKSLTANLSHFDMALKNLKGEIIQNDIYVNFTGAESFSAQLNYNHEEQWLNFKKLVINSPNVVDFNSSGFISLSNHNDKADYTLAVDIKDLKHFNQLYLNNILEGTDYEGLDIEGGVKASLVNRVNNNKQSLSINSQFSDFSLAYKEQISVIDLNGIVNWGNSNISFSDATPSELSWQELSMNQLPFGASNVRFKAHKDQLKLLNEVDIPLFDGALHINNLELSNIISSSEGSANDENSGLNLSIDGMIRPVSLSLVSSHFGWPELDGQLSAVIPHTRYNEQLLSVGGALMLQVFDGVIIVKDLTIHQPLAPEARLYANVDLNNMNLKSLTRTYNFGEIEGRLEGKFSGLVMDSWEPVEFDAYFRTPVNDKSKHRISQRAIDNLSSLGGASGLLSRSFLSIFETFGYDKIGLSCKLKNNICAMDGIENKADNSAGYYIVKGGGIPRIDVMGFQRQVNWHVLTSRLQAIQSANEAVIE